MTEATVAQVSGKPNAKAWQWRLIITAGMGFFTDAYDLFIIGVVTAILAPIWHLSVIQVAILNAAALVAAAFGATIFGVVLDKLGRKKLYGLEVVILFLGAILGASSPSFVWLLIARFIVGFGIGGDYPSSALVASESSSGERRGLLVLLVFAMQALGLLVGPLLASFLMAVGVPHNILWRLLIGFGAIPAASVFYLRRRIQESAHFVRVKEKETFQVSRVIRDLALEENNRQHDLPLKTKPASLLDKKWLIYLICTASAWFLLDVAFYGNGISSVMIINAIHPNSNLLEHTLIAAMIFMIFAVPGYFFAALKVDKIGRKPLQIIGFLMIGLMYGAIAFVPSVTNDIILFTLIYGASYFFVNFGPNSTTFLIPSEIFPTAIRAKAHGISAAVGKVGAFVGAFLLPLILHSYGLHAAMGFTSIVALLGVVSTLPLPEMKQKDLSVTDEI